MIPNISGGGELWVVLPPLGLREVAHQPHPASG